MLAQNFMSADQLHVTREEHAALVTVLYMLEREELKSIVFGININDRVLQGKCFSMNNTWVKGKCGSAGCIGGWVADVMGVSDKNKYVDSYWSYVAIRQLPLADLYWNAKAIQSKVSSDQGAAALRNFLTTGKAQWDEVLG
jgi:hypothetical protein